MFHQITLLYYNISIYLYQSFPPAPITFSLLRSERQNKSPGTVRGVTRGIGWGLKGILNLGSD